MSVVEMGNLDDLEDLAESRPSLSSPSRPIISTHNISLRKNEEHQIESITLRMIFSFTTHRNIFSVSQFQPKTFSTIAHLWSLDGATSQGKHGCQLAPPSGLQLVVSAISSLPPHPHSHFHTGPSCTPVAPPSSRTARPTLLYSSHVLVHTMSWSLRNAYSTLCRH